MQLSKPSIKWLVAIGGLLILCVALYVVISNTKNPQIIPVVIDTVDEQIEQNYQIIGKSVQGRKIEEYTFGVASSSPSSKRLLFVGGMHGGYEWNSVLLAYRLIDYLQENPSELPEKLLVTVIPTLNPDGVFTVTGKEFSMSFILENGCMLKEDETTTVFNTDKVGVWKINKKK